MKTAFLFAVLVASIASSAQAAPPSRTSTSGRRFGPVVRAARMAPSVIAVRVALGGPVIPYDSSLRSNNNGR